MPWPCSECGGENPDGMRFCGHCGGRRSAGAAADLEATVAGVAEMVSTTLSGERAAADHGALVNRELVERLASARGGVEERRLITAVFADVSGFTALAHGLDAEQLVGIIGPIVSRLADIVTRYGGYVGKFAGDAILAFFGAPVAHEDDAVRALLAARDMQAESAALFAGLGPQAQGLTLHVGVNTGYVIAGFFGDEVRMEYSVLGDAVNVAQRLEAAAPGGAVFVGHDTYLLAGSRFTFEDLGTIQVKGKPEPIQCWRLAGEQGSGVGAARAVTAQRVVGRGRELAALIDAMLPGAGGGGVAAVVGEPGTGKSALLQEALSRIADSGAQWVETHCVAWRSRPYRPYVELLRVLTEIAEDVEPETAARRVAEETAAAGVPEAAPYFLRLLGLPTPPGVAGGAPSDPLAFRQGLHDAVVGYLVARAAAEPMVLGIEDVHWADPGTVDLTRHLIRRVAGVPLSIVLTARPEGRASAAALAEPAERSALIDLGPLDGAALAELAAEILGAPAAQSLAGLLEERTGGNPLFAQQLLRSLLDMDALDAAPDGWRLRRGWNTDSVPTAVEQVLAARIDLLPRPAADLLQVAAVIGRTVVPALLRRVAGGPEHDAAVDMLVRGGFLEPVGDGGDTRLWFHHALLVDVAYGRLLRARRRDVHRQLVSAITDLYGSGDDVVDMLARHAQRGEMGGVALEFLERAGVRAESLFANEQAVLYLRQAIEIAEGDAELHDRVPTLLLRCAGVEEVRGAYREALALYERADAHSGDVRAALGRASTLRKLGDYRASLDVVRAAAANGDGLTAGDAARLAMEEGWVLSLSGGFQHAMAVVQQGLGAAESAGDSAVEGRLLVQLARIEETMGHTADAHTHAQRARQLLDAAGDVQGLATALRVLGGVEADLWANDPEGLGRARDTLGEALGLARRIGNAEEAAAALINLGQVLADLGDLDEAMRCDREAVEEFAGVGLLHGVACAYCNLANHLQKAQRWAEADVAARQGLAVAEEIGNAFWTAGGQIGVAESALHLGNLDEAVRMGMAAFDISVASSMPDRARTALETTVAALRRLGDGDAEARLLDRARTAGVHTGGLDQSSSAAGVGSGPADA